MNANDLPIDFIGIGSAKSATTWIAQCLGEHPEVCMSEPKEPAFFTKAEFPKGFSWYAQCFEHCGSKRVRGEFSCAYLRKRGCAALIHEHYPNAKLIVCLRHPIERLRSGYYYHYTKGANSSIDPVADLWPQNPNIANERSKSQYARLLSPYLERFPREQLLVLIYEDIKADPQAFMSRVYEYLGVDPTFVPPSLTSKSNITAKNRVKVRGIHATYYRLTKLLRQNVVGRAVLHLIRITKLNALSRALLRWNKRPAEQQASLEKEPLSPEQRRAFLEHFEPDIEAVEQLLGRRLEAWRQ